MKILFIALFVLFLLIHLAKMLNAIFSPEHYEASIMSYDAGYWKNQSAGGKVFGFLVMLCIYALQLYTCYYVIALFL